MGRKKTIFLESIPLISAGAKGVAIGKTQEGKTVLVKNAIPGDVVDIQIYKKKRNYLEGKAIRFHSYSQDRVGPRCKHFGVCGGCKWQNMSYKAQLLHKQEEVTQNLKRIGGFPHIDVLPIKASEKQYDYRNKMEFSFSNARWLTEEEVQNSNEITERNALGFHIPGLWSKVLNLEECHLQANPSNEIRNAVNQYAKENNLEYFDLRNQSGLLRTLMIRFSNLGEIMVLIQFFQENIQQRERLLSFLQKQFPQITSLLYAINPKGNDSLYDLDIHLFSGKDFIVEEMEGLRFRIGPKSFFQTNSEQALELYKITKELAQLSKNELVYDLYTGTGTIAQFIAKDVQKVIGIESVPEAIEAAKENAKRNGIENCDFFCGDMKEVLSQDFILDHGTPDLIITDPPRDGMHKKVVHNILFCKPKRIVYVSCNSATQARDLAILKEEYNVIKVQAVDMFPQTHHVESVVLLELK